MYKHVSYCVIPLYHGRKLNRFSFKVHQQKKYFFSSAFEKKGTYTHDVSPDVSSLALSGKPHSSQEGVTHKLSTVISVT